jgi:hypothetical protein
MEQFEKIYGKSPSATSFIDSSVPKKERIIKLRKNPALENRMKLLNIPIVDYPFSNITSIDIFTRTSDYAEDELMPEAVNEAVTMATEEFAKTFKG